MLDKTLLLKGVAGVAALGGVVGGGFVFKDQIGSAISGSSSENSVGQKGNRRGTEGESNLVTDNQSQEDLNTKSRATDQKGAVVSTTSSTVSTVDDQGIPNKCTAVGASSPCELEENDLKKIKFETLEAEGVTGDVTVEGYPTDASKKITLTIDSTDSTKKKYIFSNNSSNDVKVKKGSGAAEKSVTLKVGKTKFTIEGGKLKERTLNNYGLPKDCETPSTTCTLTSTDLEDINFLALKDGTGNATVSPSGKTVTLTIETTGSTNKKYKFQNTNTSAITITKGSGNSAKTVILKANTTTEFTEDNGSLKEFVRTTDDRGIPTKCTATGATNPCQLTAEELKNIKFKELEGATGETVTLDPESPNPQITLKISTPSASNPPKIYTFNNAGTKVTLKKGSTGSQKTVVLDVGETEFKEDGDKLVSYEESSFTTINANLGNLKLPNKCKFKSADKTKNSKECEVTKEELQKVQFDNKDTGDLTIDGISERVKLEIKILKNGNDADQYGSSIKDNDPLITFKNESSKITITGKDSNNIVIPKKSNMEFLIDEANRSTNKISKYRKGLIGLPNSWGILCTKNNSSNNYSCNPVGGETPIRFFTDSSDFQEMKVSDSDKNKTIFTAEEDVDDYNQGFKFTVKDVITSTSGSPSITLTANDTYEIKWSTAKKKWGYVKKNGG